MHVCAYVENHWVNRMVISTLEVDMDAMAVSVWVITYSVDACTSDKYVCRTCYDHRPGLVTATEFISSSTCIIGVPRQKANDGSKRSWWWRSRLEVGRFGLQHASVYVCCPVEVVLVEHGVLRRSAVKPL